MNRNFGAPVQQGDAPPAYKDDHSPPQYLLTALPWSPLRQLHNGNILEYHDLALRADGIIRYPGDSPDDLPRLGIRGRIWLEIKRDVLEREGVPVDLILQQHPEVDERHVVRG